MVNGTFDVRAMLVELDRRGVQLFLDSERLKSRAAPGALDAGAASLIRANKDAIIAYLQNLERRRDHWDIVSADRSRPLAASPTQQRLWLVNRVDGDSAAYVIPFKLRLTGPLDLASFRTALDGIVERHEALRTVLRDSDQGPVQVVLAAHPLDIGVHDLRSLAPTARAQALAQHDEENARTPFYLATDQMLRMRLLRTADEDYLALGAMHHVAADGLSLDLFFDEFCTRFEAARAGRAATIEPLLVQYADFAAWQLARRREPTHQDSLQWWKRELEDMPRIHDLPLDRPRPAVKRHDALQVVEPLGETATRRLRELARRLDATPFIVLEGVLSLVVAKWSRSTDIVIGTPVSGRQHPATAGMIGFFANTIVLRTQVDWQLTGAQWLQRHRDRCLEAYAHQDTQLDELVEALQPPRSTSHTPLFQLLFSMVPLKREVRSCGGLRIEAMDNESPDISFDLNLIALELEHDISLRWSADSHLFERATIERMSRAFVTMLAQLSDDADRRLDELDLLAPADRALLADWNTTRRPYPRAARVHELFQAQAARTPRRLALVCGERRWTYAELDARADALAHRLVDAGVRAGDVVPVVMPAGIAVPLAFLAAMKAGAAVAPLDIAWPPERLERAIDALGASLVLVPETAGGAAAVTLGAAHRRFEVTLEPSADGDATRRCVVPPAAGAPAPIYVVHTSGSTGQPKGALNAHQGVVNRLSFMSDYFGAGADEVVLQTTHHCFDSAVWQFFWPLMKGGTSVVPESADGADLGEILRLLETHRVTVTDFSPALLGLLADHLLEIPSTERPPLRLTHLIVGGEEMTPSIAKRSARALPGVRLHNFYGASEASIGSVCYELPVVIDGMVPIGKPISNVVVAVVDPTLQPLPIGAAGEILMGGDCVGLGYVGQPEATSRAFVELATPLFGCSRFYRTGDLGRYRADGQLDFLGRIDSQVKIRGYRIELSEIQAALEAQLGVAQAHAQVVGDGHDKRIVAYLVPVMWPQDDVAVAAFVEAARAGSARRLPAYMMPAAIVSVERMPLTGSGKIDRRRLPEVAAQDVAWAPPETPQQEALAQIWRELFGIERVGLHDDFFRLGGHSLKATQLVARISRTLGLDLPLRTLFDRPRLADIDAWCTQARAPRNAA